MALIFENSACPLCGDLLKGKEVIAFTRFIENPLDELIFADDAAFHRECLVKHPLYEQLMTRSGLFHDALAEAVAAKHPCLICNTSITNPDDCFALGFFTGDRQNPLYAMNYRECHYSCLAPGVFPVEIIKELQALKSSCSVSSGKIDQLLDSLGVETIDRTCAVCGSETKPSDRFHFGETPFPPPHPLSQYNHKVSHYRCLNTIDYLSALSGHSKKRKDS